MVVVNTMAPDDALTKLAEHGLDKVSRIRLGHNNLVSPLVAPLDGHVDRITCDDSEFLSMRDFFVSHIDDHISGMTELIHNRWAPWEPWI